MANIRSVQDYKEFLKENRELLHKNAVRIEDLPPDDDWILDDDWDEIYEQEVFSGSGASINSVLEDLPRTLRCSFFE